MGSTIHVHVGVWEGQMLLIQHIEVTRGHLHGDIWSHKQSYHLLYFSDIMFLSCHVAPYHLLQFTANGGKIKIGQFG